MNDLVTTTDFPVMPVSKHTENLKVWDSVVTTTAFLPRLQLFGGNSDACKEGKIGIGRYGLVKNKEIIDYGPQIDAYPLSLRFKAMRIAGENIFNYHNPESPEFQKIMADSEIQNSGCFYGPEFLLWLPSTKVFATFLLGSKSARMLGQDLKGPLDNRQGVTLKCKLVENKAKQKWHIPVILINSTPFDMPNPDEAYSQCEKFANPKDSEVESAESATTSDRIL